ncbi:odorant receptor 4-like [Copidosoma floridanum]|uniref:odorant receptor 4-like n=1 Tax=Copidosoma floridanum TaxID=29053 RepID=UPI0006C9A944|nr:odorant receptor 4-like [Copidosoma floridanum]
MDFHKSRYFSINKRMLKCMGLWPYQSSLTKIVIHTCTTVIFIILFIPQICCFSMHIGHNGDKTMQAAAVTIYIFVIFLKSIAVMMAENKTRKMYENIVDNWKLLKNEDEFNTMKEHSEFGKLLTIGYIAYMYSAGTFFVTVPFVPICIDYVFPTNSTRIRIFILDGEYGVDKFDNYGKIYIFESFTCISTTFIFCALDTTYSTCVQQCVGLMDVVKMRLKLATKRDRSNEDGNYHAMRECIILHKNALHFAKVLESSYSTNFLIVMATNVLIVSVGSVVIIMNLNRPLELIRFGLIYIGLFIHMFYLSWPGQRLVNIGNQLYEDTYNNDWYQCSIETQKLLRFMMMRCKEPCHLTAGGLYVMNMANFGSLLKTSMSYITVFSSYR